MESESKQEIHNAIVQVLADLNVLINKAHKLGFTVEIDKMDVTMRFSNGATVTREHTHYHYDLKRIYEELFF